MYPEYSLGRSGVWCEDRGVDVKRVYSFVVLDTSDLVIKHHLMSTACQAIDCVLSSLHIMAHFNDVIHIRLQK